MSIARQIATVSSNAAVSERAGEYTALVKCLAAGRGTIGEAAKYAQAARLGTKIIDKLEYTRAAVVAGTTGDGAWAGPLADVALVAAFVSSLRNVGIFDRISADANVIPLRTRIAITTLGATAYLAGAGHVKPVSSLALAAPTLEEITAAGILVITNELARSASPESFVLFREELANAVAHVTDVEFLRIIQVGVTSVASSGASAAGARADLRTLLSLVSTGQGSTLFLLVTPSIAKSLSVISDPSGSQAFPGMNWNGGVISGINVLSSDAVASGVMVLLDAAALAVGSSTLKVDTTQTASLVLDSNPSSPPTASVIPTSLYQHDLTAIRVERMFGVELLRTSGAAVATGVSYEGVSPA